MPYQLQGMEPDMRYQLLDFQQDMPYRQPDILQDTHYRQPDIRQVMPYRQQDILCQHILPDTPLDTLDTHQRKEKPCWQRLLQYYNFAKILLYILMITIISVHLEETFSMSRKFVAQKASLSCQLRRYVKKSLEKHVMIRVGVMIFQLYMKIHMGADIYIYIST